MPMISLRNIDDQTGLLRSAEISTSNGELMLAHSSNGLFHVHVQAGTDGPIAWCATMDTAQLRELRDVATKLLDQQADFGDDPLEAARKRIG